jgi:hypothetical protein
VISATHNPPKQNSAKEKRIKNTTTHEQFLQKIDAITTIKKRGAFKLLFFI